MIINNNMKIVDLSLYLVKEKTLVISDLHLGYEQYLNEKGILVPRFQFKEIKKRLEKILEKVNPKKIVINGDLKHEFGLISRTEWNEVLELFDFFKGKEIIIVKGNHDIIIDPIAKKRNVKVVKEHHIKDYSIIHGDSIPKKLNKTIIIGHEHPAVSFKDRPDEKYKCFLVGKYRKHNLIVLPSFNFIFQGSNILNERLLSPFLQRNLDNFEVFIVEDRVYKFGKVKNIT